MGVYTMELYKVLEYLGATLDNTGNYQFDANSIGLGSYPIYNESHRTVLNRMIVNRYLNREIGLETIEKFTHAMNRKMWEIMPGYNTLFESTLITFDPLRTIDMTTLSSSTAESERTSEGSADSSSSAGAKSRAVQQDFPQFALSGNADYATAANDSNATNTGSSEAHQSENATGKDDTSSESTVRGYQGSAADLIQHARALAINIDQMVINELNDLFMIVWDNGDEWLPSNWKGLAL